MRAPILSALALIGLLVPVPAQATVVKWLSLLEKTEVAPVVVHGFIERVDVEWEEPGARVQTLIAVRVEEAIKGDFKPGDRFVMRRGGGTIADFSQTAPGLSQFEAGEEVVLFLEPSGAYLIEIGIGIGKYAVESDGRNKWVTHAPQVAALKRGKDGVARVEPIQPMEPEELFSFLKKVRSFARGIPTEPNATPRKGAMRKPPLALPATSK